MTAATTTTGATMSKLAIVMLLAGCGELPPLNWDAGPQPIYQQVWPDAGTVDQARVDACAHACNSLAIGELACLAETIAVVTITDAGAWGHAEQVPVTPSQCDGGVIPDDQAEDIKAAELQCVISCGGAA